ncbi:MAG TPA: LptE family protein [Thermoanaerobaculia bacterium]|nr:LptE family protein [Thermoanaerobaculia bacterium]
MKRAPWNLSTLVLLALVVLPALVLDGCGYALVGRGTNLPPGIKNVYLKPLANRTQRQQVEQELTRSIGEELVTRQRFSLTAGEAGADAEIEGAVTGFGVTPVTFDQNGRATAYEISIAAEVKFKSLADNKVIWSNDHYTFRESYPLEVSSTAYFDREDEAIQKAAKRFAETMVSDLLEGF